MVADTESSLEREATRRIEAEFARLASPQVGVREAAPQRARSSPPGAAPRAPERPPQYESLEDGAFANALKFLHKQRQRHREMAGESNGAGTNPRHGGQLPRDAVGDGSSVTGSLTGRQTTPAKREPETAQAETNVCRGDANVRNCEPTVSNEQQASPPPESRAPGHDRRSQKGVRATQEDISGAIQNLDRLQQEEAERARWKRKNLLAQPPGPCVDSAHGHGSDAEDPHAAWPNEAGGENGQNGEENRERKDDGKSHHGSAVRVCPVSPALLSSVAASSGCSPSASHPLPDDDSDGTAEQEQLLPERRRTPEPRDKGKPVPEEEDNEVKVEDEGTQAADDVPTPSSMLDSLMSMLPCQKPASPRPAETAGAQIRWLTLRTEESTLTDLHISLRKHELENIDLRRMLQAERACRMPLEHELRRLEQLAAAGPSRSEQRTEMLRGVILSFRRRRRTQILGSVFSALVRTVGQAWSEGALQEHHSFYRRKACMTAWAQVSSAFRVARQREAESRAAYDLDTMRQVRDYMSHRLNLLTARLLRKMFQDVLRGCWGLFLQAVDLRRQKRVNLARRFVRFQRAVQRRHMRAWRKFECEDRLLHCRQQYDRLSQKASNELNSLTIDRDSLQRERHEYRRRRDLERGALEHEKQALAKSALEHLEWIESEYKCYIQQAQDDKFTWQSRHWQHHTARLKCYSKMIVFDALAKNVNWVKAALRKMCRRIVHRAFQRWEGEREDRKAVSLRERRHLDHGLEHLVATPQDLAASASPPRSTSPHRWTVLLDSPAPSPQRKLHGGSCRVNEVPVGDGQGRDTLLFKPAPWEQEEASGDVQGTAKDGWVWESAEGDGDPEHLLCMEALPLTDLDASLDSDDPADLIGGFSSGVQGREGMAGGGRERSWGVEDEYDGAEGGRMSIGMLSDSLSPISTDSPLSPASLTSPTTGMATISELDLAENMTK